MGTALSDSLQPNYANQLLTPFRGTEFEPSLIPLWKSFPVRVAVLEDGDLFSEAAYQTICASCERWVAATKAVPGGGVSFTYEHDVEPKGAQIVIRLARYYELPYEAITLTGNGSMAVAIEVTNRQGRWISPGDFERKVTHEMGHALGILGHSPDANDVMSPEPATAQISLADVNTLRMAYGGFFRKPGPPKLQ